MEHHSYHHHGGLMLLLAMSLDTLGVEPNQRATVEKIRTGLHARMEPAHVAEQKLETTLAEGIASGGFDGASVEAAIARVSVEAAALQQASLDALNELHAVLTPPERAALVNKVESHWAVWQSANAKDTDPAGSGHGRLAILSRDLELSRAQLEKIQSGLDASMNSVPRLEPEEVTKRLRAFGYAFRSVTYNAKEPSTASIPNAHLAGWGAAHLAHFVEVVSPVLTTDQRTKYAERIREHATHNPSDREIQ